MYYNIVLKSYRATETTTRRNLDEAMKLIQSTARDRRSIVEAVIYPPGSKKAIYHWERRWDLMIISQPSNG